MESLVCPHCGSGKIITLRGELKENHNIQECRCHDCHFDFLVSHDIPNTLLRK